MLVKLQKDCGFYEALQHFDIVTCDSQILFFALRLMGTPVRERVSGSDFLPRFYMARRNDPEVTIFLCGGRPGVAAQAAERINARAGRAIVVGTDAPAFDYESDPAEVDRVIAAINASRASVLVVGLGGGRQERFILDCRDRLPHVRLFLPLGGTLDYEAGTLKRPAPWVTNAGLEWLYRVIKEPRQRWRRYFLEDPPALWMLLRQRLGLYRDPFAAVPRQSPPAQDPPAGSA
jgi:exopolysaccharide biosynthesis WecB/TagA/CpsF family protein